jgi:hypothetical protein
MIRHNLLTKKKQTIEIVINYSGGGNYSVMIARNNQVILDARVSDQNDTRENPDPPEINYYEVEKTQEFQTLLRSMKKYCNEL